MLKFSDFLEEMAGKKDVKFVLGDEDVILEEEEHKREDGVETSPVESPGGTPLDLKTVPISISITSPSRTIQTQQGMELSMSPRTMLRWVFF